MVTAYTRADRSALYLSGGASNVTPSSSLGGAISSKLIKGMSPIYTTPVQGLIIEDASGDNGEGSAQIEIDSSGDATYTPPGGSAGSAVTIAEGARAVLTGADPDKYVRVYRDSGKTWTGTAEFELVDMLAGVLSMSDVDDTDRQAGAVHYRAIFVKALADIVDPQVWITTTGQSTWALAKETPVAGAIQTIVDEDTAPTSVTWVSAVSAKTSLNLGHMSANDTMGVWIRRTFPASGVVSIADELTFHIRIKGE